MPVELHGDNVLLRPVSESDLPQLTALVNEPEVAR